MRGTLGAGKAALSATGEAASLAKGLVYVSVKQATAEVAAALWGPAAGAVTAQGVDTISAANSAVAACTLSALPFQSVGWVSAGLFGRQPPPRVIAVPASADDDDAGAGAGAVDEGGDGGDGGGSDRDGGDRGGGGDCWVLLGSPVKEGYLAPCY